MRKFNKLVLLLLALSMIFVTGCVTKNLAGKDLDRSAKSFNPPADKSFIYVMRNSYHGDWHMAVTLDGNSVGTIRNKTFLLLEVLPGDHRIKLGLPVEYIEMTPADIELETLPGRSYFLSARFTMAPGMLFNVDTVDAEILSEEVGKDLILRKYKRAVSSLD